MYEDFFPKRLNELRTVKGISAREMSLSLGQNAGYINNIETGKALPSMANFFYICEYLDITPKEFFDESSKNPAEINELYENLKRIDTELISNFSTIIKAISDKTETNSKQKRKSVSETAHFRK